jgi:hypothetical protein
VQLVPRVRERIPRVGIYDLRGLWMQEHWTLLRNAAWQARMQRVASDQNPLALRLVTAEAERLIARGEPLYDVIEGLCELLMKP